MQDDAQLRTGEGEVRSAQRRQGVLTRGGESGRLKHSSPMFGVAFHPDTHSMNPTNLTPPSESLDVCQRRFLS
jgi:hypothetical protein